MLVVQGLKCHTSGCRKWGLPKLIPVPASQGSISWCPAPLGEPWSWPNLGASACLTQRLPRLCIMACVPLCCQTSLVRMHACMSLRATHCKVCRALPARPRPHSPSSPGSPSSKSASTCSTRSALPSCTRDASKAFLIEALTSWPVTLGGRPGIFLPKAD